MVFSEEKEIKLLILDSLKKIASRNGMVDLRLKSLFKPILKKVAFDTRRINQETQLNPRRGLQNYNRSAEFISEALSNKLKNLKILKNILLELKNEYGKEKEWQDSNIRILLSYLDKALRAGIDDGDFTDTQPGVGSLNYLDELLYIRYRLVLNDIGKMKDSEIKKILLSKDESFIKNNIAEHNSIVSSNDISKMSYDQLLNTLFNGVKASSENPSVKRKITIEIEDSIIK